MIYQNYTQDPNACLSLTWETYALSYTVNLLDLQISFDSQYHIAFKTFNKAMNFYLSPHSAHPPGTLRRLAFLILQIYW